MGKTIENYTLDTQLGRGVYSKVYKGINTETNVQVAVKMIRAQKFKEIPKLEAGIINEINILSNIEECPHIVRYYDMLKTPNNFYFVYEYCNEGTLENLLSKANILSQKQAVIYLKQILQAFKVLSKYNIMHRDIKPDNILLHNGIIKVADFGFCKPLENQDAVADTMLGSPIYMAPQVLRGEQYSMRADVWSLGVVLYRMLFGICPFQSQNIAQLINVLKKEDLKIPQSPKISPVLQQILRRMLIKDPKERIDWNQIFKYQIFQNGTIARPRLKDQVMLKYSTASSQASTSPQVQRMKLSCKTSFSNGQHDRIQYELIVPQKPIQARSMNQQFKRIQSPRNSINCQSLKASDNGFQKSRFKQQQNIQIRSQYNVTDRYSKINICINNHSKCIEIITMAIQIANYSFSQALILSYQILKKIQKQFQNFLQSVRKQLKNHYGQKNFNQQLHRQFIINLQQQLFKLRQGLNLFKQQVPGQLLDNFKQNMLKIYLKKFTEKLKYQTNQQLILVSQLIHYVDDQILIKKNTYDKLSKDHMLRQIKQKLSNKL